MEEYSTNYLPHDMELFRAVLVGGLYPNYAHLEAPDNKESVYNARRPKVSTGEDGKVQIYQGSVVANTSIRDLGGDFLIYSLKMRLGSVLLMASSRVSVQSLLLFGDCSANKDNKGQIDFKNYFVQMNDQEVKILLGVRQCLLDLLAYAYENPRFPLLQEARALVQAVREYLGEPPELSLQKQRLVEHRKDQQKQISYRDYYSQDSKHESGDDLDEYDFNDDDGGQGDGFGMYASAGSMSWYDGSARYASKQR
eukprot:TRINITY_DN24847_c0_g4_i1.p3 TRINITY_DN24847_c0_g4~~TRINITY_DN24847_c0_g4_i1.p3  ORF type:complete len:267 (-),score=27.96 TRINITY_DN24847_c0_g4_i1:508-1266(-)